MATRLRTARRAVTAGAMALPAALLTTLTATLLLAPGARAQTTTVIARVGMRNRATTHYNEVMLTHGRWTFPDVFWFDAGRSSYREIGIGIGAEIFRTRQWQLNQTYSISLASGSAAHAARFFVPWSLLAFTPNARWRAEMVYFPEIPLNEPARIQHIFEREKVEYIFPRFKVGAGYGAYKFGDRDWQHKPMLTTTLRGGKLGDMEFWLQRIPGNHVQAQFRYKVIVKLGSK